jgi:hypothetical protein
MAGVTRKRFPAWLAILAISLQAAWPLIAQAKPRQPGHLVPLCTVDGVTHYLEIPGGKAPVEQRSATFHEHCTLCVFGAERLAAVPPAALPPLRVARVALVVVAQAPKLHFAVHSDSPGDARAPPFLS